MPVFSATDRSGSQPLIRLRLCLFLISFVGPARRRWIEIGCNGAQLVSWWPERDELVRDRRCVTGSSGRLRVDRTPLINASALASSTSSAFASLMCLLCWLTGHASSKSLLRSPADPPPAWPRLNEQSYIDFVQVSVRSAIRRRKFSSGPRRVYLRSKRRLCYITTYMSDRRTTLTAAGSIGFLVVRPTFCNTR